MPVVECSYCRAPANENQQIWRYLDFPKFLYILEYGKLPFVRLDKLPDRFEGAPAPTAIETVRQTHPNVSGTKTDWAALAEAAYSANQKLVYVNCWHQSRYESAAMWAQYSNNGIAIQSTFRRLVLALEEDPRSIQVGVVDYQDNIATAGALDFPMVHAFRKRRYFDYERELRATVNDALSLTADTWQERIAQASLLPPAIDVTVKLHVLIQSIRYSPGLPAWCQKLVKDVAGRYGIVAPVTTSFLDKTPSYR